MFHVWPNFGQTGEIGFSFLVLSFLKKIITLEMEVLKAGFNYAPVGKILLYWTESRTVVRHLSFPVNIGWASHLHSLFLIWKLKKLLLQLFDALCSTRIAWFRIQKALINTRGIFFFLSYKEDEVKLQLLFISSKSYEQRSIIGNRNTPRHLWCIHWMLEFCNSASLASQMHKHLLYKYNSMHKPVSSIFIKRARTITQATFYIHERGIYYQGADMANQ
jgi:hypothetical protein